MKKLAVISAIIALGAAWIAQSDQIGLFGASILRSTERFDTLSGYTNAVVLNTSPRMILVTRPGEAMLCPFETQDLSANCWRIAE